MDLSTILGLVLSITSISVGDILEGGNPLHVIHLSSVLIVIPTAMASAVTASHASYVKGAYKEFKTAWLASPVNYNETIRQLVELATLARRDGVLSLEGKAAQIVDGREAEAVEEDMEIQIEVLEEYYHGCSHYWERTGESCPTFGLVGAVMGLMLALGLLEDPVAMAAGIAGAFTATVTGIFGAYAFFGPIGAKIMAKAKDVIKEKELIVAAVVGIAKGDNPRNLEEKLLGYIKPGEPKISQFE